MHVSSVNPRWRRDGNPPVREVDKEVNQMPGIYAVLFWVCSTLHQAVVAIAALQIMAYQQLVTLPPLVRLCYLHLQTQPLQISL